MTRLSFVDWLRVTASTIFLLLYLLLVYASAAEGQWRAVGTLIVIGVSSSLIVELTAWCARRWHPRRRSTDQEVDS